MADLSITAGNVVPTPGTNYVDWQGIAGEALSAGDLVYRSATSPSNTYKKAQCDVALGHVEAGLVGMAMQSVSTGQPVAIAVGQITIGSGFSVGALLVLSAAYGKIAPVADLSSTNNVVIAGWIMTGGTDIYLFPKVCSVLKA